MPFERSSSTRAKQNNFHEFRHGKTFKKTAAKFSKRKAQKQMVAAVLSNQRRYEKKGVGIKSGSSGRTRKFTGKKKSTKRYQK